MANDNVANHYIKDYGDQIALLSQQMGSRLRGAVDEGPHVGDGAAYVDQIGETNDQEGGARNAPINHADLDQRRRWVFPQNRYWSTTLGAWDAVRLAMAAGHQGKYQMAGAAAMKRRIDRIIIASFFGTATTGVAGASSVSFPAGNQIAVTVGAGAATGLNVAKLLAAQKLLEANDVDTSTEQVFCGITSAQHANLLAEIQVINKDYNSAPVVENGVVKRWGIFNFIQSELFELDGSSYRRCPVWVKSGMHFGVWRDITTDISQRKDLQALPWQIYLDLVAGASRTDEDKVMEIKCSE
jgi:hypothetical protein